MAVTVDMRGLGRIASAALSLPFFLSCGSVGVDTFAAPASLLNPSQPRNPDETVTITSAGVTPQVSHLDSPVTVMFVNHDAVSHTPAAAPELGYGECLEMATVGTVAPGQTRTVTITKANYICAYHDQAQPSTVAFQGLLVVH